MSKPVLSDLNFGNAARILNLPAPLNAAEPARLIDLNNAVEGLAWKDGARLATQANLDLLSPGASIDGVALAPGDRVLVRAQSSPAENGLYLWFGPAQAMTRAPDCDSSAKLEQAVVTIEEGASAGASFRQSQVNVILGTDPVLWTAFGTAAPPASEASAGIAEIATQAETDAGSDDARFVTPSKLAAWPGRVRKFAADFGDGAATQYDFSHNFSSRDVQVQVLRTASPWDSVLCDISRPSLNAVRLNFAAAPALNQFRVIIWG